MMQLSMKNKTKQNEHNNSCSTCNAKKCLVLYNVPEECLVTRITPRYFLLGKVDIALAP